LFARVVEYHRCGYRHLVSIFRESTCEDLSHNRLCASSAHLVLFAVPHGSERDLYRDGTVPKHFDKDALDAQIPYQDRLDLVDEPERCGSLSGVRRRVRVGREEYHRVMGCCLVSLILKARKSARGTID
jgi:hypothetical protein